MSTTKTYTTGRPNETVRVETYQLATVYGRQIRKATRVIFSDGETVEFVERLPIASAIRQAIAFRERS